ncbi:hypothetical protein [Dysgonomonas sp. GY617]|uniref:hypothetical protein n=1 Tax=Dysgonomonas sp. GY617 TaxID=2780420 RepID=UPI0018846662|nr:hypothetical protein [Dysgonomonas sp. GY617]MBF0575551.1 hypothetical protein [Dysgonomonas sp. GY617]
MRKTFLLILSSLNLSLWSQIGLNTEDPRFDLDVRGDVFASGKSKIGGATVMNPSIQLELSDADKGLLLNRVPLTNLSQKSPVAGAVTGTLVYNNGGASNQFDEGVYFWKDNQWKELWGFLPTQGISLYYASSNVVAGPAGGNDQSNMVSMPFSSTRGGAAESLVLPETGSYAFNVKLYTTFSDVSGNTITPQNGGKAVAYVGIWINNILNDISEIFYNVSPPANGSTDLNDSNLTNVILGCSGNAGDHKTVKV